VITRTDLLEVIGKGGPMISYQPIVNLWSETIVGYEALSRFSRYSPPEWYEAAHEQGLSEQLETLAIERALRDFARANVRGYLSVNASPCLLQRRALHHTLVGHAFPVQIEVTESAPVRDYRPLVRQLDASRRRGVRVAIDDLGAGHSTMQHVINLAPDALKIDRELVRGLHNVEETSRRAVLRALIGLAASLQQDVVAEGVEYEAEAIALRALGVNLGQGWHYSRALTFDQLADSRGELPAA
jgi:EAL domain-containing protein (putative c-di-GMP-specific phosphodiesterase class I)